MYNSYLQIKVFSLAVNVFRGLGLFLALNSWSSAAMGAEIGEQAPSFTGSRLSDETRVSLEAFKGKVVVLDFWASWCGPCLLAMPKLEALSKGFEKDSAVLLAVSVDTDPARAKRFMKKMGVSYDSLIDPEGEIAASYELPGMPTTYVINSKGVITERFVGFRSGDEVELLRAVNDALAN